LVSPLRNQIASLDAPLQPLQMLAQSGAQAPVSYDQQISDARNAVQQDPRRVAQVVKGWVGEDE
jgi:flagellar biosynthesis/type III secretory pathway M-ring protein FliF/YscJ